MKSMNLESFRFFIFLLILIIGTQNQIVAEIPPSHKNLTEPISYESMQSFLEEVNKKENISVSVEGVSNEERSLFLIHLSNTGDKPGIPVFFFGQQHGNEPAGKDALIYLIRYISEKKYKLPENIDLWIMPMVNPDGASKNQRRNAKQSDLNRDHQLLLEIETQVLHKVFRKIMPYIAVDCHEFGRDSRDYGEKGWTEWPVIMMDCCNNPLFDQRIYNLGKRWCNEVTEPLARAGHNYTRYFVGGVPPDAEQRHSTPEVDDARNSLATYGGLTFIIESGLFRESENENSDLAVRVDAYLNLLKQLIEKASDSGKLKEYVNSSRNEQFPEFIPTNYFWGNAGHNQTKVKVITTGTGETIEIPTMNFMKDLVVKASVTSPDGYIIAAKDSDKFTELLKRQSIEFIVLKEAQEFTVEISHLLRLEDTRDEVYNRYAGRQIVKTDTIAVKLFPANSIFVSLDQQAAKRAALLLEPNMMYGLYQYETFRNLVAPDNSLPVFRVISKTKKGE